MVYQPRIPAKKKTECTQPAPIAMSAVPPEHDTVSLFRVFHSLAQDFPLR